MATARQARNAFDALLDSLEPRVARAFVAAIQRIKDRATLSELEGLLEQGNIDQVVRYLGMDPRDFTEAREAYEEAFTEGGKMEAEFQASAGIGLPFDRRHPQAESWMAEQGARLVTEVAEETQDAVRSYLSEALPSGKNSAAIARELIGVRNRATGKREGGLIGLTTQQQRWVYGGTDPKTGQFVPGAQDELGTPAGIRKFLGRQARPRKYDRMLQKAADEGRKLTVAQIRKIVNDYDDALVRYRGNVIARTETHRALNAGRYEAMRQNAENAGVPESAIKVTWQAVQGPRTRDTHRILGGQTVTFEQPFTSPSGAQMRFPGDTSLGATGAETINCRCTTTFEIDI